MPQEKSLITEISERLDHLRTMSDTPQRRREILALERALEQAIKEPQKAAKARRPGRPRKRRSDDNEPQEKAPRKRVITKDGKRRVILTEPRKEEPDTDAETEMEKRARKHRQSEIRSIIGLSHSGMS